MSTYILRRLLLMIPTLLGVMIINFVIVQSAPGGPVEQMVAQLEGHAGDASGRISGVGGAEVATANTTNGGDSSYRGRQGLPPEIIADIEKMYGF